MKIKGRYQNTVVSKIDNLLIQTGSVGGVKRAILLMESGVGNLFFPLWIFSNPLFILRWEMELECFFGKTSGAEINHSKLTSQTFLEWLLRGRLLCKRFCLGMGVAFLEHHFY